MNESYYRVPKEVSNKEIQTNDYTWSAGMFKKVIIPTKNVMQMRDLLDEKVPFNKGEEPGSKWYLFNSTHYFIRTKALQSHSYLLYPKGSAIVPLNPSIFKDLNMSDGDLLMSKDSNVGECAIVDGDDWRNHMFSSGIVRLNPKIDKHYLFSFVKHSVFKEQLNAMSPRGSTIKHAGLRWLDCLIPFPTQENKEEIIKYISILTKTIVEKEKTIKKRDKQIYDMIQNELINNQSTEAYSFNYPNIKEIKTLGRLDGAIYSTEYKSKISLIENYSNGYSSPEKLGFTVTPGPSLEIKIIKSRIDSDEYREGFYSLLLPTHISEYGTILKLPFMGTPKELPLIQKGDILFGEAGFQKGRSIVLIDEIKKCTTNAHGLYARRKDKDIEKSIFFRCIFDWYRTQGLIDLMAVGGSGGHFSPEYFKYIKIPNFSLELQNEISRLYHNDFKPVNYEEITLDNFIDYHNTLNEHLGIWELDKQLKELIKTLNDAQEKIINGEIVKLLF